MGCPQAAVLQGNICSAWVFHGPQFLQDYPSAPWAGRRVFAVVPGAPLPPCSFSNSGVHRVVWHLYGVFCPFLNILSLTGSAVPCGGLVGAGCTQHGSPEDPSEALGSSCLHQCIFFVPGLQQIYRSFCPDEKIGHSLVAESVLSSKRFIFSFSHLWEQDVSVWWALHHLKGADSWNWVAHPFSEATIFERGTCFYKTTCGVRNLTAGFLRSTDYNRVFVLYGKSEGVTW